MFAKFKRFSPSENEVIVFGSWGHHLRWRCVGIATDIDTSSWDSSLQVMPMRCAKNRIDWAHTTRDWTFWFIPSRSPETISSHLKIRFSCCAIELLPEWPERTILSFKVWLSRAPSLKPWRNGLPNSSKLEPSSQLRWSWVSFGYPLGLSWLELAWIRSTVWPGLKVFRSLLLSQLISNKLESLAPKADNVFDRSDTIKPNCTDGEREAVDTAMNTFRPDWEDLNRDFELRHKRWEHAMSLWKQFHYNLKDLTLWLSGVEQTLRGTKTSTGEIDVERAMKEQKVRGM